MVKRRKFWGFPRLLCVLTLFSWIGCYPPGRPINGSSLDVQKFSISKGAPNGLQYLFDMAPGFDTTDEASFLLEQGNQREVFSGNFSEFGSQAYLQSERILPNRLTKFQKGEASLSIIVYDAASDQLIRIFVSPIELID